MKLAWVIGSRGLLGSALAGALVGEDSALFDPGFRFTWDEPAALSAQMALAVARFGSEAAAADSWEVHWAAGIGTMQSTQTQLATETAAMARLLDFLAEDARLQTRAGSVALASSGGAIYGGSTDAVITENTAPVPTTAYASEKLRQEKLLHDFVLANEQFSALAARFSTLYGAGQAGGKQQGLFTHISRCTVRRWPVHIYVPLDTVRDYIAADDAARGMILSLRQAAQPGRLLVKIIASERPTTISEIVSIFKRVARRAPRIITSASAATGLYTRRIQFRSLIAPRSSSICKTGLAVGIAQVLEAERLRYIRGAIGGDLRLRN